MSTSAFRAGASWRRILAMVVKEFLQLRRDRITLATMIAVPLIQLTLYGYAINTNPKNLPTAVLLQETSDVGRSIVAAMQNTKYFQITHHVDDVGALDRLLASGEVVFAVEIPVGFERALRRGDRPELLVAADATDPSRWRPHSARCARSSPPHSRTITRFRTAPSPHSRSASTAATTQPARRNSTSYRDYSAPS